MLTHIIEFKKFEIAESKKRRPLAELYKGPFPELRDFKGALQKSGMSLIAEVKHKSPSAGIIKPDFNPVQNACMYDKSGVDAISVLTDNKFFGGSLDYLIQIRDAVKLPLLRKDFIIDAYQIYEARTAGADAILLIVRALSQYQIKDFLGLSRELGLAALVEIHSANEAEAAIRSGAEIVGINNRNLATFTVDLQNSIDLKQMIPDSLISVSESGIKTGGDTARLMDVGFQAVLVGETLMREKNITEKVRELKGLA
ncbi:indole-3-glycerol phosphate synthase TrpC [bacterium]|nr:indole-3-glycerol phosphate synthase TrpC [bacterium]